VRVSAADNPHGAQEGESVRILPSLRGRFVHESRDGKMGRHQSLDMLAFQIGGLAAQSDPGAVQVGFQFVQRRFLGAVSISQRS